jgi:hypothetical protein
MTDSSSLSSSGSAAGKTPLRSGGNNGSGGSGQRVVREIGVGPAIWPLLTKTNYTEWTLIMKIKLQARNLWEAIEPRDVTLQEDRIALDVITNAVPHQMLASLVVKATVAEAWETVRSLRIGSEVVRNARAQRLRMEFESICFKKGETVDDFIMRLGSLVVKLGTLGEVIKEQHVVQKLLRVVPKHHSQVAVVIEVTQDLSKLTLEDAGDRLRAAEDRAMEDDALPPPCVDDKLLLTEEQWKEKMRQRSNAGQGSSGGGEQRRRPCKRGNDGKKGAQRDDKCHNCGRTDHWARDCRQLRNERVNLTQAEDDDEPTLLMATMEESHEVVEPALEQQQLVHLDETKAQAFLGTSCSDDDHLEGWYLDIGTTNHMMGRDNMFSELDRAVQGTVKFGDGSVVNICGKSTIIFSLRYDEHKVLTGVYWIPHLKNSIISVGQMDEGGTRVLIEGGVLRVWDQRHCLLAQVQRTENHMYRLELQVAMPLCLAVHQDDDAWRWHERLGGAIL